MGSCFLIIVLLQLGQVIEGVDAVQLAGVNQAEKPGADLPICVHLRESAAAHVVRFWVGFFSLVAIFSASLCLCAGCVSRDFVDMFQPRSDMAEPFSHSCNMRSPMSSDSGWSLM